MSAGIPIMLKLATFCSQYVSWKHVCQNLTMNCEQAVVYITSHVEFILRNLYLLVLIGNISGGHEPGWREVHVEDPVVKDAAHHAVKSIQERSNSLFPYELLEIVRAKAQVSCYKWCSRFFNVVTYS